jgi:probable F420-dependent oxidoreductase
VARPFTFAVRTSRADTGREWRDKARRAEDLGYFAFHVSDHVLGPGEATDRTGHPPAPLAIIPALMALADATERLRVGARVLCLDYHNPVVLAKELATIDLFSDGRLEIGLGAGWLKGEYEALGLPFDAASTRVARLAEAVTLMKALFADGPVTFHGTHFRVEGFEGAPKPVQRPHPPIAIGGGSQRVLELAAREADVVSLNYDNRSGVLGADGVKRSTAEHTMRKIGWIAAADAGRARPPEIDIGVYFAAVTDDAVGTADPIATKVGLSAAELIAHPHALIGSVDAICDELARRREMYGISYVTIGEDVAVAFAPVVERLAGT